MKRLLIRFELRCFGHCYCAAPEGDYAMDRDDLSNLGSLSLPVPTRARAERMAARRSRRSGQPWTVTKWMRR